MVVVRDRVDNTYTPDFYEVAEIQEAKEYYLFEKCQPGGNSYKRWTLNQMSDFFDMAEMSDIDDDADSINSFIEANINNKAEMHFCNYYVEEF